MKVRGTATIPSLLAFLWVCAISGCGMRTPMGNPVDAASDHAIAPSRTDARPMPDSSRDLLPVPEVQPELPIKPPVDAKPVSPDMPADLRADGIPDRYRDLPDLIADLGRDLPTDQRPDWLPDVPPTDSVPDRIPDLIADRLSDVAVGPDMGCSPGQTLSCMCNNGLQGAQICLPSLRYSECGCGTDALMRVKNGVIGTWTGTATTPWVPPYRVTFNFDSYGHYSAKSLDGAEPALYYGTDIDSPLKHYTISDIQADGDAIGSIDIVFDSNSVDHDELKGIALSTDLNHLKFYFMHAGTYGPLQYDLRRDSP
jgi:hypothetical protein